MPITHTAKVNSKNTTVQILKWLFNRDQAISQCILFLYVKSFLIWLACREKSAILPPLVKSPSEVWELQNPPPRSSSLRMVSLTSGVPDADMSAYVCADLFLSSVGIFMLVQFQVFGLHEIVTGNSYRRL